MKITRTHYDLLGITGVVTDTVIRQRITEERARLEILKHIPAKRAEAERRSAELEAAAAVLLDPAGRKRYDESLAHTNLSAQEEDASGNAIENSKGVKSSKNAVEDTEEQLPPAAAATVTETQSIYSQGANAHTQGTPPSPEIRPPAALAAYSTTGAAPTLAVRREPRTQEFPGQTRPDDAPPSTGVPPPPATRSAQPQLKIAPEEIWSAETAAKGSDAGLHLVTSAQAHATGADSETKKNLPFGAKIFLGLFAATVLIIASIYIFTSRNQQSTSGVTPGSAPPKPTVPEAQPTPLAPGHIVDLRPPQVSLLNPPALGPSPASARDPRMAQGEVTLQAGSDPVRLIYPDGKAFILDQFSGPARATHYADEYGTWVVQADGQKTGSPGQDIKLQLSGLGDINGDGWPEVVLENYSGGAHCCTFLIVLSLRAEGPAVVFAEHLGSASASMLDLDGDGRKEILTEYLFEYALGSFATGTLALPVAYSAGPDGVYRVNTRAFKNWLQTGYEEERTKLPQTAGDPEQHDTELINLFFVAYLTGQTSDAYSYLSQLEPLPRGEHPLVILRASLNTVAPEVAQEPAFQQLMARLHSGGLTEQPTPAVVQSTPEPSATPTPANAPAPEPAESKQTVSSAPSHEQVLPAATPTQAVSSNGPAPSAAVPGTPASAYSGPASGFIVWKGTVGKHGEIIFDGSHVSTGTVEGELPGVRVVINLDTKNYALVEYPSESNGWKHFKIRSNRKVEAIIIPWQIAK